MISCRFLLYIQVVNTAHDIWKLLAGAAIFVLGIGLLEEALKAISGRGFKLFLKKQTGSKFKAIIGGTVVTALMQSSSVVNLLMLSMVGAGIVKMQNALAVMLGSNLGTTFTGWVVATFGFKLNIEAFALPMLAVAGLAVLFATPLSRFYYWCRFLIGFAFLFLGLQYMKDGMTDFVQQTNLAAFAHYPLLFYTGVGLVLTALVQSSSVMIALILSALHAGAIDLPMAASLVLGAEIGTTLKLALASVHGVAAKKRVALGNILFNTINTLVILVLLRPVLNFITDVVQIHDPLFALVFFQSFLNFSGILLFLPFLNLFGKFLENRFQDDPATGYLHKIKIQETDLALETLELESRHFVAHVLWFYNSAFSLPPHAALLQLYKPEGNMAQPGVQYAHMKKLYGELHTFYLRFQNTLTGAAETERLDQMMTAIRNLMYAAKSIKDALPDIEQLRNSSNDQKFAFFETLQQRVTRVIATVGALLQEADEEVRFVQLTDLYRSIQAAYADELKRMYRLPATERLSGEEISTLMNLNRALITSFKSLVFALKDLLLSRTRAAHFDELPGFIR